MIRFRFWLLLFFSPFSLTAQSFIPNPDWRFDNFNSQNHFISREVSGITVDNYGYVWACSRGVQRFDGYKTVDFNSFEQGNNAIKDNYTDVLADNAGRIWLSSAGLCYYNNSSGKFIYVTSKEHQNISYAYALSCYRNYLWFVCDYGLAKLNLQSLQISFTSLKSITDPICTFLLNDTTLLVTSRERIYLYNIKTGIYSARTFIYNHALLKIFAAAKSDTEIFLATSNGLFTLKNLQEVSLVCAATKDEIVADLLFLPQDKAKKYLFLATDGQGIKVFNTATKKIEFSYVHDQNNPYSLPNNIISRFFADNKGKLWISTNSGISMLELANQRLKMRFLGRNNIGEFSVTKIIRDKFDSTKVWMAVDNRGMLSMDWITKRTNQVFSRQGLGKINDFKQVSKSRWLIITQEKVMEWSAQRGILSQKKLPVSDSLSLLYHMRNIIVADSATCFITTNRGLFQYDLNKHVIRAVPVNDNNKPTDPLQYDLLDGFYDQGVLWIASRNGLFSYSVASHATKIYRGGGDAHDYFFFGAAKGPGNQIVCVSRNGMAIFNKRGNSFEIVRYIAGFYKPFCTSVICKSNMLWIGTEAGILNYNFLTRSSSRAYHEGLLTQVFLTSPVTLIGNEFVVGFRNGYAYFAPDQTNISMPSAPVIEQLSINNQPVFWSKLGNAGSRPLILSHAENSIGIAFTAFSYTDPEQISFRYRLKNTDAKWQYAQGQRSANYAQLPPGSYSFYLQTGVNGAWNDHPAALYFLIKPPYWATWWFRVLVILAIGFGLYCLYRYRIKHILAIERIRERIASDFHDDIGAALSSISIFSEVADTQLEKRLPHEQTREIVRHISKQSHSMLDAMDDIIWAVNPQNDHFIDLAVRMREFSIPLLEAKNIKFEINIPDDILKVRIPMAARKNIFLVFKECINNLLKHSACSAVRVSVNKSSDWVELLISDNGKGFDVNAPNSRNGLKNMQKRAAEIGAEMKIASGKGGGTTTSLRVNIV